MYALDKILRKNIHKHRDKEKITQQKTTFRFHYEIFTEEMAHNKRRCYELTNVIALFKPCAHMS